jgi:hypothetical protein
MKKNAFAKFITITMLLLSAILFVVKFGGPSVLRLYIESSIGTCKTIPILCMAPEQKIHADINKEYIRELLPYQFPKMGIYLPRGFNVMQQQIRKVYYKRDKYHHKGPAVYLLYKEQDFFINLFPRYKAQGITDDYEFIKRTMYANLTQIKNLSDAFFVIMKGLFTPDIGNQRDVFMAEFRIGEKRGFINYNLTKPEHYFDCNVIDSEAGFFKIYIKDINGALNLEKVLTMISTVSVPK